jgi:NAD(P)-dependent dehydrogenase (short-subunit alcohol dehydrogenase family)
LDLQLEGKRALVTGASRGIGKAVALKLAQEGCDVAICARSEGPLLAAAAEIASATGRKVIGITCDTTNAESIKGYVLQAAETLGGAEILVNSAARLGGSIPDDYDTTDEQILQDFEEKSLGYLRTARAAVPFMKQAGFGRIINIGGLSARTPGVGLSTGTRNAAVAHMSKSLANSLGPFGITVNVVYPGATVTDLTIQRYYDQAAREGRPVEEVLKAAAERTLIKHLVTAEDIANVVAFLSSPLSISITGEAFSVGGGAGSDVHY